jgi:cytochrome c553
MLMPPTPEPRWGVGGLNRRLRWSLLPWLWVVITPAWACTPAPELAAGCDGCHGRANEQAMATPLYGRDAAELDAKLQAYATSRGGTTPDVMQRMLQGLPPELLTRLAAHFACKAAP